MCKKIKFVCMGLGVVASSIAILIRVYSSKPVLSVSIPTISAILEKKQREPLTRNSVAESLPRSVAVKSPTAAKPKDHWALLTIRSHLNAKDVEAATSLLKAKIAEDPRDDVYLEEMAMLKLRQGKTDEGEEWLRKTIDANPRNQVAMGELMEVLRASGRDKESLGLLREIIASCSDDCPAANLALGEMLSKGGDIDEAIIQLSKVAENPNLREAALQKLATLHSKNGDQDSAKASLNQVIAIKKKFIKELKDQGINVAVLERSLKEDSQKFLALKGGGFKGEN